MRGEKWALSGENGAGTVSYTHLDVYKRQGVAMAAALSRDIPITEYAPLKIKMAITGNGQASKEQVCLLYTSRCV